MLRSSTRMGLCTPYCGHATVRVGRAETRMHARSLVTDSEPACSPWERVSDTPTNRSHTARTEFIACEDRTCA